MVTGCTLRSADQKPELNRDWPTYGGNHAGNRYSPLTQINTGNVKNLQVAWMYDASEQFAGNEPKPSRAMEIQCQPIVIDGILYATTPGLKAFALRAATGEPLWKFDPFTDKQARYRPNRGVMYWADGGDKRILYVAGPHLYALDAKTGKLIDSFGKNGKVDLHDGLETIPNREIKDLAITSTTPGVIYKNTVVMGTTVSEYGDALPGHVRGYDVRTGRIAWTFHTVPQPGEFGYDTWPPEAYKKIGGANSWAGMVLDEKRGVVYLGTGSPSVDFYGGARQGMNLFSDCILALNAETGKMQWYYQTIHHDLWDNDLPCPPNLVRVKHNGKLVDAVAQTTKDGLVYVLDRDTGASLFPVEERPVPTDGVPGEHPWPTQKFPLKPLPFARQVYTEADLPDLTPEARAFAEKRFLETRRGHKYIPPSIEGTLLFGISGGAEWGGNAADPEGILYQNANEMPWDLKMTDIASLTRESASLGNSLYLTNCSPCHGLDRKGSGQEYPSLLNIDKKLPFKEILSVLETGRGRMPSFRHLPEKERTAIVAFLVNKEKETRLVKHEDDHSLSGPPAASEDDFPYVPPYSNNGMKKFKDPQGYPAIKPPWGTLNAIDLNTGEYVWRVPLGEFPELTKKGIPITGTENYGGPIVTAGGLVFIAGTKDERIRAFDKKTGRVVWEYQLPAGGFATPCTYMVNGKQYIVIAAGGAKNGHKPGGNYVAFALPEASAKDKAAPSKPEQSR